MRASPQRCSLMLLFAFDHSSGPLRFQVSGLVEGQWYSYRVRAFNKLGASRPCRATDDIQAVDARGIQLC